MDKLLYSKYSNQRNPRFNIRTDILKTKKGRVVRKYPEGKESETHLSHVADLYEGLTEVFAGSRFVPNVCKRGEGYLEFEYVQGTALEALFDERLEAGDLEGFQALFQEYACAVRALYQGTPMEMEEDFCRVFGREEALIGTPAARNIDIDLIPSNVILMEDGRWVVLDYEWTFDFLIPVDFLIWRACCVYLSESENRRVLSLYDLCALLGISGEQMACFHRMEEHFSKEYCFQDTYMLQFLYTTMGEKRISLSEINRSTSQESSLLFSQLFFDLGDGYSEENSIVLSGKQERDCPIHAEAEVPHGTRMVRWDPAAESCLVELSKSQGITDEGAYALTWTSNGVQVSDRMYALADGDPQLHCTNWKPETKKVVLAYEIAAYPSKEGQLSSSRVMGRSVSLLEDRTRELHEKAAEAEGQKAALLAKNEEIASQKEQLAAQEMRLQEQEKHLEKCAAKLESIRQNAREECQARDAQIGQLSAAYHESQRLLAEVTNSRSWRLTRPLRAVTNQMRKSQVLRSVWHVAKEVKNAGRPPAPLAAPNPHAVYPAPQPRTEGGEPASTDAARSEMFEEMRRKIREADVVSFDLFDTLVKRLVNTPEDVFALTGQCCGLEDFRQRRAEEQRQASIRAERELHLPHADMDQIYDYLQEQHPGEADWQKVKETEITIEKDCLKQNPEMYEIYRYAKMLGKRVIITSDMYLLREDLEEILKENGYADYDSIYISSDVHVTKFRGDIYPHLCEKEGVAPGKVLHIGDNYASDVEEAQQHGLMTCHYRTMAWEFSLAGQNQNLLTQGTLNCLFQNDTSFWYRLGAMVGGPLYASLADWFEKKVEELGGKKVYFLARDGYNLHQIFKGKVDWEMDYLYASRRALLLAGIEKVDEDALELLPPFTMGQTIREVLEYLDVLDVCGGDVTEVGFMSLDDVIRNVDDMQQVKKLYQLHEEAFLKKCAYERACAEQYFRSIGFLDQDSIVFDCGWNGSSQYLLKRFLDTIDYRCHNQFLYVGIMDTNKARKQLRQLPFYSYLFQFDVNRGMQARVKDVIVLFELFFGAPHESVYRYTEQGVVLEHFGGDLGYKEELCRGIKDYVELFRPFGKKYGIEVGRQQSMEALRRLAASPTSEETVRIGDIENVDGFARQKGERKYIAKLTEESYNKNPGIEIYWPQGLLKRPDIPEELKVRVARDRGLAYKEAAFASQGNGVNLQDLEYQRWIEAHEKEERPRPLLYHPKFSVVIPVYNVTDEMLIACIESVRAQTYRRWELHLVDDASTWPNVRETLKKYEADKRIHIHYREVNGHISRTTNDGIERSTGEFLVFMDCDDVIAHNALYEFARLLNQNRKLDFIYSDEDKLSEDGTRRHSPFFKPDWSPDTFASLMYTNHLAVYRASLVKQIGGLRSEYDGCQDYDMTLRFMEVSDNKRVGHIPKVLYHWRERGESIASTPEAKPYALAALKRMKEEMLTRRGLSGQIEYVDDMYQYRPVYEAPGDQKVSIIIPSKDNPAMLKQCIKSILYYTEYRPYEIVVVDNGSSKENREEIEAYAAEHDVRYHYEPMEFNFSRMCNIGAGLATGELLLFLNDDIEVLSRQWLSRLAGQAALSYAGAVGAKLYYPNTNHIQHAGILNLAPGPCHALMMRSDQEIVSFGRNRMDYNFLCVTGACLMVQRRKFEEVHGFDEKLPVAYNDVDLCFRLYEAGYYNALRNDVTLYHYESVSRGGDDISEGKRKRLASEKAFLYRKHPALAGRDPFYNENLSPQKTDYSIRDDEEYKPLHGQTRSFVSGEVPEEGFTLILDQVLEGTLVTVKGWFFWSSDEQSNQCEVELVLCDETGKCLCYETNRIHRMDVAQALGNKAFRTGFECMIDSRDLHLEKTGYRIGLCLTLPGEEKGRVAMSEQRIGKQR